MVGEWFKHDCKWCVRLSEPNWYYCGGSVIRRDSDFPSDYLSYPLETMQHVAEQKGDDTMRRMCAEASLLKAGGVERKEQVNDNAQEETVVNDSRISETAPEPAPTALEGQLRAQVKRQQVKIEKLEVEAQAWEAGAKRFASDVVDALDADGIRELIAVLKRSVAQPVCDKLVAMIDVEDDIRLVADFTVEAEIEVFFDGEYFSQTVDFDEVELYFDASVPISEQESASALRYSDGAVSAADEKASALKDAFSNAVGLDVEVSYDDIRKADD